ncbi:MAG: hypothetical protein CMH23_10535 [Methylophaga sp.]|uniref:hypothetical protein n=1 Tax=Methylophaga sp. TaxID=2024840 RepID=UPI000C986CD7|nr:hypothetical protein [Methylophaga sp.]MBN46895.1 hypothetical protein [Methylophaga sp.]
MEHNRHAELMVIIEHIKDMNESLRDYMVSLEDDQIDYSWAEKGAKDVEAGLMMIMRSIFRRKNKMRERIDGGSGREISDLIALIKNN